MEIIKFEAGKTYVEFNAATRATVVRRSEKSVWVSREGSDTIKRYAVYVYNGHECFGKDWGDRFYADNEATKENCEYAENRFSAWSMTC